MSFSPINKLNKRGPWNERKIVSFIWISSLRDKQVDFLIPCLLYPIKLSPSTNGTMLRKGIINYICIDTISDTLMSLIQ